MRHELRLNPRLVPRTLLEGRDLLVSHRLVMVSRGDTHGVVSYGNMFLRVVRFDHIVEFGANVIVFGYGKILYRSGFYRIDESLRPESKVRDQYGEAHKEAQEDEGDDGA
uniref:Uncharacterized protein n=1 Tax=Noccaea caerulescens TaxID=107243 RepID=A0A1J3J0R9_NOCCA